MRICAVVALGWLVFAATASAAPPTPLVAETEPLSPEEQRAKFHLPPGFEIQLVVSEPHIAKPMNLNFDARGRLWVTNSLEYPWPAKAEGVEPRDGGAAIPDHPPRDRLTVLSQIDRNGTARSIVHFAEGLDIPIGQIPLHDRVLLYSIPSIFEYKDTDGDGRADAHSPLYGKFGNVDTHGMVNSFTRGIDGWIYACHGFRNTSHVADLAGHKLTMNSGNTFRFAVDGSRIEQYTWGQVNPFGITIDSYGNVYNADCHSRPLTMLLRGAHYPSFGKPHDGLGFGPEMIDHNHGSTGICGAAYYSASQFPADYQDNIFLCNPVTGRVHRDKLQRFGSTYRVDTQPDFITCDDGWFRPVDAHLGPDGALYIADFYNCIIGHYEVPLTHPRRDRERGRIWRVVYRGTAEDVEPPQLPDLAALPLDQLVARLGDANLVTRTLATNHLIDTFGQQALEPARQVLENPQASPEQQAHALWVIARLSGLDDSLIETLADHPAPLVRVHLQKALSEQSKWSDRTRQVAVSGLADADGFVQRAAADALAQHPHRTQMPRLLQALQTVPEKDTHLRHTLRLALRAHFSVTEIAAAISYDKLSPADQAALAEISLAVPQPAAARLLWKRIQAGGPHDARTLTHIARYADDLTLRAMIDHLQQNSRQSLSAEVSALQSVQTGLRQRGTPRHAGLVAWASDLSRRLLTEPVQPTLTWVQRTLTGDRLPIPSFATEMRPCADGVTDAPFYSSLPLGEQRVGILRSEAFVVPRQLTFWMAGHNGFPKKPDSRKNILRLRDAESDRLLSRIVPPRQTTAQLTKWDLQKHAGCLGYLELVDSDTNTSYAWIAVGRFSLPELNPAPFDMVEAATRLVTELELRDLIPLLETVLKSDNRSMDSRAHAAEALTSLRHDGRLSAVTPLLADPQIPAALRQQILQAVLEPTDKSTVATMTAAVQTLSATHQLQLANRLAGTSPGAELLLQLIEQGHAGGRLLQNPALATRLKASGLPDIEQRIATLTENLPAVNEQLQSLIANRRQRFQTQPGSAKQGVEVFRKNCAACHQVGTLGKKIGPQLDGIGNRGLDRLLEDIFDPNRNVDGAFRTTTLALRSGRIVTGLVRREEGQTLVLADDKGKEFSVPRSEIEEESISAVSLMPGNVGEVLTEAQLCDLLAFLLSQSQAPAEVSR